MMSLMASFCTGYLFIHFEKYCEKRSLEKACLVLLEDFFLFTLLNVCSTQYQVFESFNMN